MITCLLCAKKLAENCQLCPEFQITRVLKKKRLLLKALVESQFGYRLLTWIFHSRKANSKINHIHERTQRMVYKDNISSFEKLVKKDKSFCIHRNIQSLAIELFKIKNNLVSRYCVIL